MYRKCLTVVALALMAGCARFHPRPIVPADSAAALDARTLDNPAFDAFLEKNLPGKFDRWPVKSWDFESLTLAAFYYHPSLAVARAQWQTAQGGEVTAAERPNPTLTASPGYDFNATSMGLNPWIPGVTFDLPIETMGKRGYRKSQAAHLSDSARLNIATTAWQVRANLRAALIDFAAARQRAVLLENQSSLQQKIVESLQARVQAGAAATTELALVQIASQKIHLDLADARIQQADARVRIADAIGVPVRALDGLEMAYDLSAIPTAGNLTSAEARDQALRSRTDILGALADYAASESALQLEIAKQYPDIHIGPYYQYNQGTHQLTLNISAEIPLLNQHKGPIAEAEARRTESAARFNALQAKALTEIDRAVAAFHVTRENLDALESLAAAQKKQSDAIVAQQQAGAADQLDVLNAQLNFAAGSVVQLDGWVKAQQSFAALEAALQRPLPTINSASVELSHSPARKETQP